MTSASTGADAPEPLESDHSALRRDITALNLRPGLDSILGSSTDKGLRDEDPVAAGGDDSEPFADAHAALVADLTSVLPLGEGADHILDTASAYQALLDEVDAAVDTDRGLAAILGSTPRPSEPAGDPYRTRRQRERVTDLVNRFLPIGERLSMTTRLENLHQAAERVRADTFSVLVIGEFNRGKSTLINALLGQEVLPAFATETTDTICEVHFGESPKVMLFPIEPPDAAPFETTADDLERHVTVDEENPDRPSPYRKVELYWPAALCRDGVVLVDSPGLHKSRVHEERTVGYLRSADAIVFVIDSQNAWSRAEEIFVRALPPGIEPFFVFNKINLVDPRQQNRLRKSVTRRLAEVRPRGPHRFYFIDAKQALTAARQDVADELSGVGEFTRDLQRFLATERAAVKIGGPPRELAEAIREARNQIPVRRGQLDLPLADLEYRVEAQRRSLAELLERRTTIVEQIDRANADIAREVRLAMREFFQATTAKTSEWAATVEVRTTLTLNPMTAQENAEAFTRETVEGLQLQVTDAFLRWRDSRLTVLMEQHAETLSRRLEQDLNAFETRLDRVRSGTQPSDARGTTPSGGQLDSPMARVLAAAGGMPRFAGAGTVTNARLSPSRILRNAFPQVALGASILLATPFGWVAMTAAAAMAALGVFQVVNGIAVLEEKLRAKVGEEFATRLAGDAAEQAERFTADISVELKRFRDNIAEGLTIRIEEVQKQFEDLLAVRRLSHDELSARQADLDAMEALLGTLDDETADLLATFGPPHPGATA